MARSISVYNNILSKMNHGTDKHTHLDNRVLKQEEK